MAKTEATLILKLKDLASKGLKKFSSGFSKVRSAVTAITALAASMGALALRSSEVKEVQKSFTDLAASQGQDANKMLGNMRELSRGTVSDLNLMKQANNALLLGLPVDRFGDMLNIARSSAKATGQSMQFMLSSIVTGLGRGSRLILDNLGIIVDSNEAYQTYARTLNKVASELTESEKKQAFMNEALRIGNNNASLMGATTLSLKDRWAAAKAEAANIATTIGEVLIPAMTEIIKVGANVAKVFKFIFNPSEEERVRRRSLRLVEINTAILEQEIAQKKLKKEIDNTNNSWKAALGINKLSNTSRERDLLLSADKINVLKEERANILAKIDAEKMASIEEKKNLEESLRLKQENDQKKADLDLIRQEADLVNKEMEMENEKLFQEEKSQAVIDEVKRLNDIIVSLETDRATRLDALNKKSALKAKIANDARRKQDTAFGKFKQFILSEEVAAHQDAFARIATLSNAKNKVLMVIGKAAAIANIAINTAQGISKAYAQLGAFGAPAAVAIGIAGGVQAAKVAGIQLAEGGIVQPRPGGVQATIAEAGQAEAVIPLEDADAPIGGTTINLTVNGGMLGTTDEAREFAVAIDQELFNLRKGNESLAFEEGLI